MIGRQTTGKGFGGCDRYLREKKNSREIGRSLLKSTNKKGVNREIGAIRRLKPNLEKAIFHASLSLSPGQKLNDVTWSKIGHEYMQKMGFTDNQYLIYRHSDTDKDHIHIVANRIKLDGSVTSDSFYKKKSMNVIRGIELKYGLEVVKSDHNKTITPKEYKDAEKTGIISLRVELQGTLKTLTADKPNISELIKRLQTEGVYMKFKTQKNENVSGLTYVTDKGIIKASDIGKAYTFSGLQNRKGVNYDKNRDFEEISRSTEFAKTYEASNDNRGLTRTDSDDVREHKRDGDIKHRVDDKHTGASKEIAIRQRENGENAVKIPDFLRDQDWVTGGKIIESRQEEIKLDFGDNNRRTYDNADHIRDLASLEKDYYQAREREFSSVDKLNGNNDNGERKEKNRERLPEPITRRIHNFKEDFRKQIKALNAKSFDVVLVNVRTQEHKVLKYTDKELIDQYKRLKVENAKGFNVAIRAREKNNYVVVDQIKEESLVRLKNDGLAPALVVESQGNNQAWINLKESKERFLPISDNVKKETQKALEIRYGGKQTGVNGYVGAVGFREHTQTDLKPITRLVESVQRVAKNGKKLIQNIVDKLNLQSYEKKHNSRIESIKNFIDPQLKKYNIADFYKSRFKEEFGNDRVLKDIQNADFTKKVDVFNFQERVRSNPVFTLGTSPEIIKKIELDTYFSKLKNIDLLIAKEMHRQKIDPEKILENIKTLSPSFSGKNENFSNTLENTLDISRGRGISM